jgi:hypothetical protein
MEKKKMQTMQNMSLGMYALSSLDYYDPEYFESIFLSCIESDQTPDISQLSMMTQACATLRRSEYTSTLAKWFEDGANNTSMLEGWSLSHEKEFLSCLQSLLFLIGEDNQDFKRSIESSLNEFLNHFEIEVSSDHALVLPSLLWSLSCLDMIDEHPELTNKALTIIKEKLETNKTISFPGAVLLNQVLNELEIQSITTTKPIFSTLSNVLTADSDHKDFVQNLAYRYDQLEARDNSTFSKKMFGLDI